ncbi:YfiR/HmsC family protein [Fulvivirga aurantia]|uniref:YfiR/HmsC family protein n=1 Tax=Fulvivirga aurantia TaxID=2529383 RepID=UPI001627ABC3
MVILLLTNSIPMATPGRLDGPPDPNAKIKALFLYNFTKYVEWPAATALMTPSFRIGVYGEYPNLVKELNNMAATKKHKDQPFKIINFFSIEDAVPCHIIYIAPEKTDDITALKRKLDVPILIVSDEIGAINKGAVINFFYESSKQRMEISPANAEKDNLKVSSQLLGVSKVVN